MPTPVDICNLALANLGHGAKVSSIAPEDGSVEAAHCARFYPIARDQLLSKHDWNFASRRATLVELAVDATLYGDYRFAYALPFDYLRLIGLVGVDERAIPMSPNDFDWQVEAKDDGSLMLLCDMPPEVMTIRYVHRQENAGRYPPLFVTALGYELAALLAGPIRKGGQREEMLRAAAAALVTAAGVDSNTDNVERRRRLEHKPDWLAKR